MKERQMTRCQLSKRTLIASMLFCCPLLLLRLSIQGMRQWGAIGIMAFGTAWLLAERRRRNQGMTRDLMTDVLTGGDSNAAFQYKCRQALKRARHGVRAIVALDIKHFTLINLQYDREEGDRLLKALMHIIMEEVGDDGFAARSHADVFFAYLEVETQEDILAAVRRIQDKAEHEAQRLNKSLGNRLELVFQPGAYLIEELNLSIPAMQDRALLASRSRSAAEDGVCKFFDGAGLKQLSAEQTLNASFRYALDNHEFEIYLQPKISPQDGSMGGAEALVRWNHPQRGLIPPAQFIPLFEKNGKICELDFYVLEEACRVLRHWLDTGREVFPISLNVSRRHFDRAEEFARYGELVRKYRIPKGMLELELTETIFLEEQNMKRVKAVIEEMHRLGFRCSLDDFGSGFTSICMLTELEIDGLKLDRCLFSDWNNPKARILVELILDTCRKFDIRTVAEGIEEKEKLEFLKEKRCDLVQGYIYAKPMPLQAFEKWLEASERKGWVDEASGAQGKREDRIRMSEEMLQRP